MKVCLSLDDFSPVNHNMNLIKKLKEHYPKFKISVFSAPFDNQYGDNDPKAWIKSKEWLEAIKSYDWIEILPHGLMHSKLEWQMLNYEQATKLLDAIESVMEECGIENRKIFKAPYWEISYDAVKLLADRGYTLCHYPEQQIPKDIDIKKYVYNWSIEKDIPKEEVILGHGHVQNVCGNGLSECFTNLLNFPEDTEFVFISEYLKGGLNG